MFIVDEVSYYSRGTVILARYRFLIVVPVGGMKVFFLLMKSGFPVS